MLTLFSGGNRVKELREEPYTQKEAEAAIGLRTDNGGPRLGNEEVKEVEMTT
jgi:bud site selection protein 20